MASLNAIFKPPVHHISIGLSWSCCLGRPRCNARSTNQKSRQNIFQPLRRKSITARTLEKRREARSLKSWQKATSLWYAAAVLINPTVLFSHKTGFHHLPFSSKLFGQKRTLKTLKTFKALKTQTLFSFCSNGLFTPLMIQVAILSSSLSAEAVARRIAAAIKRIFLHSK